MFRHFAFSSLTRKSALNSAARVTTRSGWISILGVITALTFLPLCAKGQEAGSPSGEVLTLEEAVALALQHNRLVQNAEIEKEKYEDKLAAAKTRRLPAFSLYTLGAQQLSEINFEFQQGVFGTFPGIGPIPSENTALTTPRQPTAVIMGQVTQPLSQQYRIGLNLAQLKLGREIAEEQVRSQKNSTINQVKQAYYGVLQTLSGLHSAEEATELYRELDRITNEYVIQQVALKSESLEVKTRLAKSEYDTMALHDLLLTQKEQLNHLLGRDIRTDFRVSPVPEATLYEADLIAAHARALEQRPEVREARLRKKQAEYDVRLKKAEYIPEVSLTFHYLSMINFDQFVPKHIAGAGILLSWEVFDWGRKKRELAEKTKTVGQADTGLMEAESAVLLDVDSKFRKLRETRQLLRVGQLAQETALETVRVTTNRYNQQASLLKNVLQAQTSLAEANYQYQQALLAFWTAKAELEKALGEDQ